VAMADDGAFGVHLAAFTFAHDGPRIDAPPPTLGCTMWRF
jgi:hypothetical protein